VERNKKLENPLYGGKHSKKAEDDSQNQYLAKIPGQAVAKQGPSPQKEKLTVNSTRPRAAFDIGEKINMQQLQKKKGKEGDNWACVEAAQDYILSVNRDSEELLLSLHSIFPRLALGRLKMFFSLLGENFDLTRQFLLSKSLRNLINPAEEFKSYHMPENNRISSSIRNPGDFAHGVNGGLNYDAKNPSKV